MVEANERSIDLGGSTDIAEVEEVLTNKKALQLVKEKKEEINVKFVEFKKTILTYIDNQIIASINISVPVNIIVDDSFMRAIDSYASKFSVAQKEEIIKDVLEEYKSRNFSTINQGRLACAISLNESEEIPGEKKI